MDEPSFDQQEITTGPALFMVMGFLLISAYALRVWGANFGLPAFVAHPDEPEIALRAYNILWTADYNPRWFHYPSGYIYTQAVSYIFYFLYATVRGAFRWLPEQITPEFYLFGRTITALFGTLTVLVVYLIGQKAYRTRTGMIAAVLLAFSYLHIVNSHYITADVPAGFWAALCALFSVLILRRGETKWYVLAGLVAGFAAGTKYNAGLVVMLPLLAHVMGTPWGEWGWLDRRLAANLLATLGGFILSTPYAVLDLHMFLNDVGFEFNFAGNVYMPGYSSGSSAVWYLRALFTGADAPLALAYLSGLVYALAVIIRLLVRRHEAGRQAGKCHTLLSSFPMLYGAGLLGSALHFERYLLPIIPILSVLAAVFLDQATDWGAARLRWHGRRLAALATGLAVLLPFVAGILFDWSITRLDIRPAARDWVIQNIPAGSSLAVERYNCPLPRAQAQAVDVLRLWDHDAAWYARQKFDYAIASNGVWTTMMAEPATYAQEVGLFHDLQARYVLVKEFSPAGIPPLVTMGYPTIAEYHFPRLWIFRIAGIP